MSKVIHHVRNENLSMENDCRTNTEGFFHTISWNQWNTADSKFNKLSCNNFSKAFIVPLYLSSILVFTNFLIKNRVLRIWLWKQSIVFKNDRMCVMMYSWKSFEQTQRKNWHGQAKFWSRHVWMSFDYVWYSCMSERHKSFFTRFWTPDCGNWKQTFSAGLKSQFFHHTQFLFIPFSAAQEMSADAKLSMHK